jgi:hypothetical protein
MSDQPTPHEHEKWVNEQAEAISSVSNIRQLAAASQTIHALMCSRAMLTLPLLDQRTSTLMAAREISDFTFGDDARVPAAVFASIAITRVTARV